MNQEMYRALPVEIQEEIDRERDLVKVAAMAVTIASEGIAAALRGEPTGLKGLPKKTAPVAEWHGWFMQQAAKRLHEAEVI